MTESTNRPSDADVFLLGAGFSRAINSRMPLTDELGTECVARLDAIDQARVPPEFEGAAFEPFMSMLAIDQPYLTDSENLRNRRLFMELTNAIAATLAERQFQALALPAPQWLEDLVSVWHHSRSAVVTFNYDTLVEAVTHPAAGLLNRHDGEAFAWPALINNQPPEPPGLLHVQDVTQRTLALLKLHGSTNWFWQPDDPTGMTAARRHPAGRYGAPEACDDVETARWWPGRIPMIIPPTASKSAYYRTPLLREIWLQARRRLAEADRVYICGYSLPMTDLSTRELLRTALLARDSQVVVADPNGAEVAQRIVGLGIEADRVAAAYASVEALAERVVRERSARVASGLRILATEDPEAVVAVHWGDKAYAVVVGVERQGTDLVMTVDRPARNITHACRARADSEPRGLTLRQFAEAGPAHGLRVGAGDDSAYLVAHLAYSQTFGHSLHWRLLTASRTSTRSADGQPMPDPGTFIVQTSEWM